MSVMTAAPLTLRARLVLIPLRFLVRQCLVKPVPVLNMRCQSAHILLFQRHLNVRRVENGFLRIARRLLLRTGVRLALNQFPLMMSYIKLIDLSTRATLS